MICTLTPAFVMALAASNVTSVAPPTIPELAISAGRFETLVAAVGAADLGGALSSEGPFTVFAPNDAAFAKLPEGTVEALLADKEALTKILTFHVVPGKVTSDAVVKISEASTVAGINARIEVKMGEVYVSGAKVIKADIAASNGVIHVIDSVMLPPDF